MSKIIFKKFLKEVKDIAIIAAVFLAVLRQAQNKLWAVMQARRIGMEFRKQKSRISAGHLRDLSIVLWTRLAIMISIVRTEKMSRGKLWIIQITKKAVEVRGIAPRGSQIASRDQYYATPTA